MLFNSFQYLLFFPIVCLLYFAAPFRWRTAFLLLASYYFYMCWRWEYVALIIVQTEINFLCGLQMVKARTPRAKKGFLVAGVVMTLAILFFFKYYNFANESLRSLFAFLQAPYHVPRLDILLPIGVSFHTFQTLSYIIDLYRGKIPVERSFAKFALYVSFFPLLVAGPIERANRLLPQLERENHFDVARLSSGLKLMLWGFFKKVVIADRLAEYVNQIYPHAADHSGLTLLLATYCFAFQIYCDFSGYTDIAIGSARVLGYDLMQNFNLPYLARSISDFWQRWHISLSTWFRDYVYIPMGGSRVSSARWAFNIVAVFAVSGLWHGANWTFVIWGLLHGGYYLLEKFVGPYAGRLCALCRVPERLKAGLQILITFHLVLLAWVFFRAASLQDALLIVSRICTDLSLPIYPGFSSVSTMLGIGLILVLIAVQMLQYRNRLPLYFSRVGVPIAVRWCGYLVMLLGISMFGKSGNDFIYFQF
ncbi:MAG TPA: MBOAT family O-acyltransferase [Candidatus Paceibacterota bacterium]|nr:MBOAT family O-acyltransferase [Verrucomicrobiota bacterium]HSA12689.1 MBOAT family O-acyltransferase [Candidatus Paceibacterota bacterium]